MEYNFYVCFKFGFNQEILNTHVKIIYETIIMCLELLKKFKLMFMKTRKAYFEFIITY